MKMVLLWCLIYERIFVRVAYHLCTDYFRDGFIYFHVQIIFVMVYLFHELICFKHALLNGKGPLLTIEFLPKFDFGHRTSKPGIFDHPTIKTFKFDHRTVSISCFNFVNLQVSP
jgi:hypothetical protein